MTDDSPADDDVPLDPVPADDATVDDVHRRVPGASDRGRPLDAVSYLEGLVEAGGAGDAVATGFPSLDALLGGGLRRGDLVVLAGDVGSGKSSLALAMALRAADNGKGVALFSGEHSSSRLYERALALQGRARLDDLRHGRLDEAGYATVAAAALALRERSPMLAPLPPNGLPGLSDLLIEHLGLDLLVLDPLQSLPRGQHPQEEELAQSVRQLKELAVRRNCAVLAVSHLATPVRGRADPRVHLEDLGALGTLRQLADAVLGLYREELYETSRDVEGAAEVHVLKHRGGGTGYADLYFYKQWLRFEDMVEPDR